MTSLERANPEVTKINETITTGKVICVLPAVCIAGCVHRVCNKHKVCSTVFASVHYKHCCLQRAAGSTCLHIRKNMHHTMSAYLKSQGCTLVGFERSMWTVVKEGHVILLTAHIDDFIIACADRRVLDEFRTALLQRSEGTYEGEVHTYLGCEILLDLEQAAKTLLSQKHYAEDVLRTYDYWECIPALTPMIPGARLTQEQCDPHPEPAFHRRYRGIVGGYLVNMTRPDLAWSYSELSKYVQNP